ncbi:MAG: glycosyltransferase family 4 protein [Candidatus Schekmanbacteria bacterium]|nr:glycosyltransferase family 4 protein [Candidatus Schekmanbacteria bacterium]
MNSRPLTIGINTLFLIPGQVGGSEVYLRNLLQHLAQIDRENNYILFTNQENSGSFPLKANFREILCRVQASSRPARILWEQVILPVQAKIARLDLLFSPGYTAPLIKTCKSIVSTLDMQYQYFPQDFSRLALLFVKTLVPLSARYADKIITISASSKKDIIKYCNVAENKVAVIHLAAGENFYAPPELAELNEANQKFHIGKEYIITVANSYPHKNLPRLLEAFYQLRTNRDIQLVIVGISGRGSDEINQKLEELKIKHAIIFTGRVSDRELILLYQGARLFVFPSLYEGFGLPVLEAMASGTPVVCSNLTSLPEIAGDAAVMFDPYNPTQMADMIAKVLDDNKLREVLIEKGRQRCKEFSWQKTARKTLDIFYEVYNS